MDKVRSYRESVRVLVIKDDEVLLGTTHRKGGLTRTLPGGGVEKGDSREYTVIKECLEEVGVVVEDPTFLNVEYRFEYEHHLNRNNEEYKGGHDYWYMCRYVGMCDTLLGLDNDSFSFEWVKLGSLVDAITTANVNDKFTPILREVVSSAVKLLEAKRRKNPLW